MAEGSAALISECALFALHKCQCQAGSCISHYVCGCVCVSVCVCECASVHVAVTLCVLVETKQE